MNDNLHKCGKPDCFRQVSAASVYCCYPCSLAAEGRYEIHEHSPGCEQRHAERGTESFGTKAEA